MFPIIRVLTIKGIIMYIFGIISNDALIINTRKTSFVHAVKVATFDEYIEKAKTLVQINNFDLTVTKVASFMILKETETALILQEKEAALALKDKEAALVLKEFEKEAALVLKDKDASLALKDKEAALVLKEFEKDAALVIKDKDAALALQELQKETALLVSKIQYDHKIDCLKAKSQRDVSFLSQR